MTNVAQKQNKKKDNRFKTNKKPLHEHTEDALDQYFAALVIPIAIGLALSAALPRKPRVDESTDIESAWTPNCQVPWCPELEPATAPRGAVAELTGQRQRQR
jgi:hypothetical protein